MTFLFSIRQHCRNIYFVGWEFGGVPQHWPLSQNLIIYVTFLYYVILFTAKETIDLFFKREILIARKKAFHDSSCKVDKCLEEKLILLKLL
jgi:hypothetical protein